MADQIVLSWEIDAAGTSLGAVGAAAALNAVPLYDNPATDPVLGQLFGLTVASDVSAPSGGTIATRTLTLNITAANNPKAPPPFQCRPDMPAPPPLPYVLRRAIDLVGGFTVVNGGTSVATTKTQVPSLGTGDVIEFSSQPGALYIVASVLSGASIDTTLPYTGPSGPATARKWVEAPAKNLAVYSTSDLDTAGAITTPNIMAGPGAQTLIVTYLDSTGAGPFNASVLLTGRRPAPITLQAGSIDIAVVEAFYVLASGGFSNSVGQLTLVEMSEPVPAYNTDTTPDEFLGPLTDEAQLLIDRPLVYLPPSYFALSQQPSSSPQLAGDFFVTTGSKNVPTSVDQTSALFANNTIEFVSQPGVLYDVVAVTSKLITISTEYTGIDVNNTPVERADLANAGTKGNLGTAVIEKRTGATKALAIPGVAPTNAALSAPLAQFVNPVMAVPPPNPPALPATISAPTYLSGLFTRTLSLALAMPVVALPITFA